MLLQSGLGGQRSPTCAGFASRRMKGCALGSSSPETTRPWFGESASMPSTCNAFPPGWAVRALARYVDENGNLETKRARRRKEYKINIV